MSLKAARHDADAPEVKRMRKTRRVLLCASVLTLALFGYWVRSDPSLAHCGPHVAGIEHEHSGDPHFWGYGPSWEADCRRMYPLYKLLGGEEHSGTVMVLDQW